MLSNKTVGRFFLPLAKSPHKCGSGSRDWAVVTGKSLRFASSRSTNENNILTPEEAGRRAEKLAREEPTASHDSSLATLLAHAGVVSRHNAPLSPPIHLATTYTRPAEGRYQLVDSIYTRQDNPTRLLLETIVGQLECHGDDDSYEEDPVSCAFSSGVAAASSIVLAHSSPVKVIVPNDLYHGVPTVLQDVFDRHGIKRQKADYTELSHLDETLSQMHSSEEDVILWMETPSNPLCQVIDIAAVCKLAQSYSDKLRLTTVVDSTLAPPCVTQPLRLGADIVMHSGTKYFGGHSDLLLGLATTSPWTERGRALGPLLRQVQISTGAVASPWDAWLTMRGMRTLHVRQKQQCQTALSLAKHCSTHPLVSAVHYPGLESHPQHEVAKKQMSALLGYGGVLSVELENEVAAMAVAGALCTIKRATSLGGTESLVEHRRSIEPPDRQTSPPGLLRISVGLEDATDLISDVDQALSIAEKVLHTK